jgi:diacylglycerol kinase (ATP)
MADNTPFLVINPHADDKRLGKKVDNILEIAKDIFGDIEYEFTTKIGDGIPIAQKAVKNGHKTLISVGGDGTLNELVNVAVKTDIKVGMIPGGSACDSHKTHGIPKDIKRAFEIIAEGYYERFPVGLLRGDTERYFIEMINGAFIGQTSAALYDRFEWAHGELGYAYAAIRVAMGYKPHPTKVTIDNKTVREINLSTFAVSITDCISDFEMLPGNHPRKGDFAILIARDLKGFGLVKLILKAINGNHIPNEKVEILRGKHVVIESEEPHVWESEGEIPSRNATRIETQYIPDAVNLIIPKGWKYGLRKKERDKAKKKVLKKQPPFDY